MTCVAVYFVAVILNATAEAALQCYGCHGTESTADYRPVDASFRNPSSGGFQGNHRTHMGDGATQASCAACHPGSGSYTASHRNGNIRISSRINNSPAATSYNNITTAWPQTSTPALGSCNSVNCHFEFPSPAWGSDPADTSCTSCHAAPPSDGAHGKKHGQNLGTDTASCIYCHPNHLSDANRFAHATSAGKRSLMVRFTTFPNTGGAYSGDVTYPAYLPSQFPVRNGSCNSIYCHSDGRKDEFGNVGPANRTVTWSGATTQCYSCHKGLSTNPNPNLAPAQTSDSTFANCSTIFGAWSSSKGYCTPDLSMASNAHHRLVGQQWVRKYPCYYCHNATMNQDGTIKDSSKHVNKTVDIEMAAKWAMGNRSTPSYNPVTKVCNNVYCHSDGTTDPEDVRPIAWTAPKTECNACHGHPTGSCSNIGCHDGKVHADDPTGKLWTLPPTFGNVSAYHWPVGQEWMGALPMFPNQGPLSARPNSHPRHAQTDFTCDQCHAKTVLNGECTSCHDNGIPAGGMSEVSHIDAAFHVNKTKDVHFKNVEASYDPDTRICSNTLCHPAGANPVWGDTVNSVTCLSCHGTTGGDVDDYNAFNGTQGRINKTQWETSGHGRGIYGSYTSAYPVSKNPAANFPGNPCWYCHDNSVLHKDDANIYRLKMHTQYERRFEKECVYCHMEGTNIECLACHVGQTESLSPQATLGGIVYTFKNTSTETKYTDHTYVANCINGASCHDNDSKTHNVNAGVWTPEMKADVKNQYLQMGVCLQCHDDDSSNQCVSCHVAPESNPLKYSLGYDPGTGFIKPKKARASAGHFGYKHYRAFTNSGGWTKIQSDVKSPNFGTYSAAMGIWKGGKFCWDCHDPHGDSNIFMIQKKVTSETDGWFGTPKAGKQKDVVFLGVGGADYVKKTGTIDGVCNVCHSPVSKHYTAAYGDGHNYTRRCTTCHEHRFADSHANKQNCTECHESSKPIPKHTAFGLPRDCTKCHTGTVGRRMDIMGQMKANSHHVQGVETNNKHCYACHWEATPDGLIDNLRHTGYNYKNYTSVKDDVVDLVIWQANGVRPTFYSSTSATTFLAKNMAVDGDLQRAEVSNISNHCLSCHSDQNNDADPFGDCKTPRQYAWDLQSIASRYSQTGTTKWGKYVATTNAAKKDITKSFSAHGNAVANGGGWNTTTGLDGVITDTRGGANNRNVQCFDCHNSHGSKVLGTTSSYVTFNGTTNGANLKETRKEMGGYANDYKASSNASGVNPFGAGAGQCFDCHNTATAGAIVPTGKTPWGYTSTFGATAPIMGYKDTPMFGQGTKGFITKNNATGWLDSRKTILGGHMKASTPTGQPNENLAKDFGTATGGSTTTLVDSAKVWTVNKWLNFYLLMGSGSNSTQIRKITGNTATTLTVEAFDNTLVAGDSYRIVPYSATVNGLCSGCHDPHGVSPTLGSNQPYAVPLLKGTWMTSPYKEDMPPVDPTGTSVQPAPPAVAKSWGKYRGHPTPTQPWVKYNLDRTTFGGSTRINEKDSQFAGLCLNCHKKEMLSDGSVRTKDFRTAQRIHESVKGWGLNLEHSFTCSKCHQPHNSGLPRLMQTDCLDYKHRGGKVSEGVHWYAQAQSGSAHSYGEHRGYPIGSTLGVRNTSPEAITSCHGSAPYNPGTYPTKNYWNDVTRW